MQSIAVQLAVSVDSELAVTITSPNRTACTKIECPLHSASTVHEAVISAYRARPPSQSLADFVAHILQRYSEWNEFLSVKRTKTDATVNPKPGQPFLPLFQVLVTECNHGMRSSSQGQTPSSPIDDAIADAAVTFAWMLVFLFEHVEAWKEVVTTEMAFLPDQDDLVPISIVVQRLVLSIGDLSYLVIGSYTDLLTVAVNSAIEGVKRGWSGVPFTIEKRNLLINMNFTEVQTLSVVSRSISALGAAMSGANLGESLLETLGISTAVVMVLHVEGSICTLSLFQGDHKTGEANETWNLIASSLDGVAAGDDAVDQALLHQVLAAHQTELMESPLDSDGKQTLLRQIELARLKMLASTNKNSPSSVTVKSVAVELPIVGRTGPLRPFDLSADMVENTIVDVLFRKITLNTQSVIASATKIREGLPSPSSTSGLSRFMPTVAKLPQLDVVVTSGALFSSNALRKRVESLCRTLTVSGTTRVVHQHSAVDGWWVPAGLHNVSNSLVGAQLLSCAPRGRDAAGSLAAILRTLSYRPKWLSLPQSQQSAQSPQFTLEKAVVLLLHGDTWGMLVAPGTPLPTETRRLVELPASTTEPASSSNKGGAALMISAVIALAACDLAAMQGSREAGRESPPKDSTHLTPLCNMRMDIPRVSMRVASPATAVASAIRRRAAAGQDANDTPQERFSLLITVTVDTDGSVTLSAVHAPSGSVSQITAKTEVTLTAMHE